mmetsp:Transcript_28635/g.42338  ORF Transcript_28635/g.42338 Transcript_28635/m.42338 type:complete len:90 (-) Transcript_28635:299-568(-)
MLHQHVLLSEAVLPGVGVHLDLQFILNEDCAIVTDDEDCGDGDIPSVKHTEAKSLPIHVSQALPPGQPLQAPPRLPNLTPETIKGTKRS